MPPWLIPGLVSGGLSAIGSLISRNKGGPSVNPAAQTSQANAGAALGSEAGVGNAYGNLAQTGEAQYGTYQPQANAATDAEAAYLKKDPYTDSYSTQQLGTAANQATGDYNAASAQLDANAARRGVAMPGANSASLAGGYGAIGAARAGQVAGAQNQLAYNKIAANQGRLTQLQQLMTGAAQTGLGNAESGLQGQTGANAEVSSGNLALSAQQQAQANYAQQIAAQQQQALMQGFGGIAQTGLSSILAANRTSPTLAPQVAPAAPPPPFYPAAPPGGAGYATQPRPYANPVYPWATG